MGCQVGKIWTISNLSFLFQRRTLDGMTRTLKFNISIYAFSTQLRSTVELDFNSIVLDKFLHDYVVIKILFYLCWTNALIFVFIQKIFFYPLKQKLVYFIFILLG